MQHTGGEFVPVEAQEPSFGPAKTYEVGRAKRLCVPVSKNGEAITVPEVDLMCFGVKLGRGQARHVPVIGINTHDEFWGERLRSVKETELCVSAETTGLP